ncbi:MAG: hypothetical protein RMY16_30400 [Nostoc sp. DedQUE12b]|nr:hypothetical protein [Nostoc sp. DedQUE12b]MDZ8089829.1 hypothetical protein [Nostoc sp. DedQUE12b]
MAEIHNLSMMDAEYIPLATQGYSPNLEHLLKIPTHLIWYSLTNKWCES